MQIAEVHQRISVLDTEINNLNTQLQQLTARLHALSGAKQEASYWLGNLMRKGAEAVAEANPAESAPAITESVAE